MAQTSGVINGTNLRVYASGSAIAYATSCTLSMSKDFNETLHKDNAVTASGWRTIQTEGQQKTATINVEGLYNFDGANNTPATLFDLFDDNTLIEWMLSTEVTNDVKYSGSGYITSLEFTGPVEENASFTATIDVSGQITKAVIGA